MSVVANKSVKSIIDCDAGDVAILEGYVFDYSIEREVAMVIEAPRGRAVIFAPSNMTFDAYGEQGEAVRAFMEQHRNGK